MSISPLAASLSGVAAILVVLFMTSRWRSRRESVLARVLPPLALAAFLSTGLVGGIQFRQAEHVSLRLQMAKASAGAQLQPPAVEALAEVRQDPVAAFPVEEPPIAPAQALEPQLALAVPAPTPPQAVAPVEQSRKFMREVAIYFGTDRARTSIVAPGYGASRAGRLELGRAVAANPAIDRGEGHVHEARLDPTGNTSSHAPQAVAIETLSAAEFLSAAAGVARQSQRFGGQALLFVHGMSTSFQAALAASASTAEALAFDGPILLYSWPSGSEVASYSYDSASAAEAVLYLREFLELSREVAPRGLNIVAVGMGSELVLKALGSLTAGAPSVPIGEIVLLAPDMDADALKIEIDRVKGQARGITAYVTGKDRSLAIARRYFGGNARAGDVAGAQPMVIAGVDTIEVPVITGDGLEWTLDGALGTDLRQLFETGARAGDRLPSQARITAGSGVYWSYR